MNVRPLTVCAVLLVATGAIAQMPAPKPMGPIAAPAPFKVPVDLGTKRAPSFNAALGRAGLPVLTIPPPPAFARLTPMAPVTNGAKITEVGQSTYVGRRRDAVPVLRSQPSKSDLRQ